MRRSEGKRGFVGELREVNSAKRATEAAASGS